MAPTHAALRVRLVQIRERAAVIAEEQASFGRRARLAPAQLAVTNVLADPLGDPAALLDGIDAVLIGGAGAYSVTDTYAWTDGLARLCHACAERAVPLFGSCWGHQFIARAFGGEVVHDAAAAELGTCEVALTDAGRADPLFGALPSPFPAQMGHHDRVRRLPEGAAELARNATAPHQAFRLAGLPIYGTQFHSELDGPAMRARLLAYRAFYPEMADDAVFDGLLAGLRPTPDADDLLYRFLQRYAVAPAGVEEATPAPVGSAVGSA